MVYILSKFTEYFSIYRVKCNVKKAALCPILRLDAWINVG